ncbi:MAG: HAD family phosphatase [Treponema sp.]|jgi:putative hydrolase of the HAD superfamily|nr:HAD family phosphatase [Treponema sp.]
MVSTIKAVVFDFGNVISLPPPPEVREEISAMTGLPLETLAEMDRKHRGEYDRGAFDGKGYYKSLLAGAGIFPDDRTLEKIAEADQGGWKHINAGTVKLMRDIKKAGFILGILSNIPHDFLAWGRANIPVFTEADTAVFSCEVNAIKPEPAIYEKLKNEIGCDYGEIVFFDDLPDNIEKARELGINGFLWDGPEAARMMLKKIDPGFFGL